jgi:hypothetical protein
MLSGLSFMVTACDIMGEPGNGKVVKQSRNVGSFKQIETSGAFDIVLKQGPAEEVAVETDENLQNLVSTKVEGTTLEIDTKDRVGHFTKMKVYITVKELDKISASGAVNVETESPLNLENLDIECSGSVKTNMEMAIRNLKIDCSGSGKLYMKGTASRVEVDGSGAVDLFAYDLLTEEYNIDLSGAGKAEINVTKKLRAEISGAGSIRYKGSPSEISQEVSGAGTIKKAE